MSVSPNSKILVGLGVGTVAGLGMAGWTDDTVTVNWIVTYLAEPAGQIFLRLLLMVVIPLVFSTLILGVSSIGNLERLGRLSFKTMLLFLGMTLTSSILGLIVGNVVRPGAGISVELRETLLATFSTQAESVVKAAGSDFGISTFINLVPRNPLAAAVDGDLIAFIVFTLVFALALTRLSETQAKPVLNVLDGIARTTMVMIGFAMKLAPIGVAGFAFAVTVRLGLDILVPLGLYCGAVLVGLVLYQFGVLAGLVKILGKLSPVEFYQKVRLPMLTAFATSSSSATLPTTVQAAEKELGIPRKVSGFVLPLGATLHMNGTAFFIPITLLFLAQAFGVPVSFGTQVMIAALTVLTAVSAAGIPMGAIPLIVVILESIGVPGESIALIFGVEAILGMARTSTNVTGDLVVALAISQDELIVEV